MLCCVVMAPWPRGRESERARERERERERDGWVRGTGVVSLEGDARGKRGHVGWGGREERRKAEGEKTKGGSKTVHECA